MAKGIQDEREKSLRLAPEYSTPYSYLIRDEIVMGVPRYFLERWLPLLGPAPATVVNTLRQLNYRGNDTGVTIAGETLAAEAAMSRRYLYTCLDTPWVCAFVRTESGQRMRTSSGKLVQQMNRYTIRMDDPLTPADAEHLLTVLTNLADTPLGAAQRALEYDPSALWAASPSLQAPHFATPRPITVHDVLRRAFPTWTPSDAGQKQDFSRLAEALHRHMTLIREDGRTSKIIVPQYFRKRWWKRLGHDLAWSYLWLRSRVYDNPEEAARRDTCWIASLNTLLDVTGRPREWWRRNVETAKNQPDGWSVADFFRQVAAKKGRDSSHPQWVARQFEVAFELPVAPEDRAHYVALLRAWHGESFVHEEQHTPVPQGSATPVHTEETEVRHNETHRLPAEEPHLCTPACEASDSFVHTGLDEVSHIRAQGSATSAHRESESFGKASPLNFLASSNSKQLAAAAENANDKPSDNPCLIHQLADALEKTPHLSLYQAVDAYTWLKQTWPEPVRPHTPAWTLVTQGQLSSRDLVALVLAVWADNSIKHPPRYLSWLVQRWQTLPEVPPVDEWERWRFLADLPLAEWGKTGRTEWLELAPRDNRALPFGLDAFIEIEEREDKEAKPTYEVAGQQERTYLPRGVSETTDNGLDERPGEGTLTIRDIWRATLGQLSLQLNRSTYTNWVEGAKAISYADGVLTVRARHVMARDLLTQRLNASIESTASSLAQQPITILYTADSPTPTASMLPVGR